MEAEGKTALAGTKGSSASAWHTSLSGREGNCFYPGGDPVGRCQQPALEVGSQDTSAI